MPARLTSHMPTGNSLNEGYVLWSNEWEDVRIIEIPAFIHA
jgi:hypothetical protein